MSTSTAPRVSTMDIKVGDKVGRDTGEDGAFDTVMWLTVTDIKDGVIYCNRWTFDQKTGMEIDHDLKWGPEYKRTGAYITRIKQS